VALLAFLPAANTITTVDVVVDVVDDVVVRGLKEGGEGAGGGDAAITSGGVRD
jgi:hypothetical protein